MRRFSLLVLVAIVALTSVSLGGCVARVRPARTTIVL